MPCPACPGSSRTTLSPNYFRCTHLLPYELPTGAHPSGVQGPVYEILYRECGTTYQEGLPPSGDHPTCPAHALFAIGRCADCRDEFVCGHCPRRRCARCALEAGRKAREIAAVDEEKARAAEAERQASAQAAKDAHDARVAANPYSLHEQQQAREAVRRAAASRGPSFLLGGAGTEIVIVLVGAFGMFELGGLVLLPDIPLWGRLVSAVLVLLLARYIVFRWPYRAAVDSHLRETAKSERKKIGCRENNCSYGCLSR